LEGEVGERIYIIGELDRTRCSLELTEGNDCFKVIQDKHAAIHLCQLHIPVIPAELMIVYDELDRLRNEHFLPLLKNDEIVEKALAVQPVEGDKILERLLGTLTLCELTGKKVDVRTAVSD
jgi:hypothetical protein